MGSLTTNSKLGGKLVAYVMHDKKKVHEVYLHDVNIGQAGFSEYACKDGESVEQVPDPNTERAILYVSAPSGSGKSYYTRQYIAQYHKRYPSRPVYVFSSLQDDPTLDKLSYLKRIKIKSPEFMATELSAQDFKDSLVVADDCDAIFQQGHFEKSKPNFGVDLRDGKAFQRVGGLHEPRHVRGQGYQEDIKRVPQHHHLPAHGRESCAEVHIGPVLRLLQGRDCADQRHRLAVGHILQNVSLGHVHHEQNMAKVILERSPCAQAVHRWHSFSSLPISCDCGGALR